MSVLPNHWDGATVFWQIDRDERVRTGKIMLYNSETGKRVKHPFNHVTWVHSLLHKDGFHLRQCFFGEHLLASDPTRPVALVESEKTALFASYSLPQYLWIASGGKNGCFNEYSLSVLVGRNVVLFPDLGATEYWKGKIGLMKGYGIDVRLGAGKTMVFEISKLMSAYYIPRPLATSILSLAAPDGHDYSNLK